MSTTPDIPAEVMRLAQSRFELGAADYRSTPQMIAEAIVSERARFAERVEAAQRAHRAAGTWGDHHEAFARFAADLRNEWGL